MEDIKEKKREIREDMAKKLKAFSTGELTEKTREIEDRLFKFANFLESKVVCCICMQTVKSLRTI